MMQWVEKLFNKEDQIELNDDNLPALEAEFSQLKGQVVHLTNQLNQGKFGHTELGKEALNSLNQLYIRLSENQNNPEKLNTDRLRQEKQNFQSFWKIYSLEINTQLGALKKSLSHQRQYGFYSKEIDRGLNRINKSLNQINELEFPNLCNEFGILSQFYEKLHIKIEEQRKKPVEKIDVKSVTSEQHEQLRKKEEIKTRLLGKLDEFRKSLDFLISHLEASAFKSTDTGIDTLKGLNVLKNRLLNENLNLDTFTEDSLNWEKKEFQNFLSLESKEIKKQLREFIADLRTKRSRGFYTPETDHWIKEADDLINQESTRFFFLCDGYAKLHQSYLALNVKISESAQQEYSGYLKKITELQIGFKCQTVQNSSFLAEYEKEQFLKLAESIQAEFKLITIDNIQAGDAEKKVVLSNFQSAYDALLGKESVAQQRSQSCLSFQSMLDQECNLLSEDSKALFTLCVKQSLLAGKPVLENSPDNKNPHPLIKLFQAVRQIDVSCHNLQQSYKAYEKFVRQNPLNPLHSKNGIKHAQVVTESDINEIRELVNAELTILLNRIADSGGALLEDDVRSFNQSINKAFSHWQCQVAVDVSEKSGDKRHSFNNYVKFWMESSKAHPYTRLTVNGINEEIGKQKNSLEFFFSFFSPNKQRFSHHDLRTFVHDNKTKFEVAESKEERDNIFKQFF